MAVVLMEGFDHVAANQTALKGWSASPTSMQTGRFGGQAAEVSNLARTLSKLLPSTYATLIAGCAVKVSNVTSALDFFQLRAGATATVRISCNASGQIQVRNSGGTIIATGTTVLVSNAWNYIEVKAFINGASGTVEVHLNGAVEIASTTGNFGSTNLDTIALIGNTSSVVTDWDDIYAADTTGAAPRNTFLGDVRIATVMPTSDGAHSQWTPSTGTAHWSLVDETTPNDDTDYVSDATPGHYDTFGCGPIDTAATVFGVQTNLYARKDDAAVRQIAPVIRQSGTDHDGATVTLTSTYAFYTQLFNQDPTPADWTPTTVNADEYGVKEIA
jgi:hypothetical protein